MKTIHKYPLKFEVEQLVQMPQDAKVLTVQMQYGFPVLWALVNTDKPMMTRFIRCYSTGQAVSSKMEYISTVQDSGGQFIWHFFDMGEA